MGVTGGLNHISRITAIQVFYFVLGVAQVPKAAKVRGLPDSGFFLDGATGCFALRLLSIAQFELIDQATTLAMGKRTTRSVLSEERT